MSDVGTVRGRLVLDDAFTPVLNHASASIMGFGANLNQMSRGIMSIAGNFNYLKGSIAGLGIRRLAEEVVQAQQATDRMKASLLVATGSFKLVGEELAFVRGEASRLGLDFASIAQGYGQFAAASKGTGIAAQSVRDTFIAVAEASTVLGLSSDKTTGALNAIQQMMTKGTVQAEELRGQLGDRIPGAVQMMARALNVSTAQLNKMLEAGKVITADVLPAFAAEMRKLYAPGVASAAQSLTAEINRTKTALYDLLMVVADNIGLKTFTAEIGNLIRAFTELGKVGGGKIIEAIGVSLSSTIGIASNLVSVLNELIVVFGKLPGAGGGEGSGMAMPKTLLNATPIEIFAEALEGINIRMRDGGIAFQEWKKGVLEGFKAVAEGADIASGRFAAAGVFGSVEQPNNPKFVGPPVPTTDQRIAGNAAATRETSALIAKMVKDFKELERTSGDAFDLRDKLENQKKEMKAFEAVLKETSGDFDKAKRYAKVYYDVLKAGLDPTKGAGKELYELGKSLEDQQIEFDAAEDAMKEYFKGVEHMDGLRDKYDEKQKKRDAAAKKAADALSAQMKKSLGNLQERVDGEMALMLAQEHGADATRDAARELEIMRTIQENMPDGIKRGTTAYNEFAQQIRDVIEPMLEFRDAQDKILTDHKEVADAFRNTDWGSDKLNKAANGIGDMIEALGKLRAVQDMTSKEAAAGWASMLVAIDSVLEATGAYAGGGSGGFGGSPEGNYAEEGAQIGAIIGGIIGAFYGAPEVGMAIGGAAGGMLGGFVKKGADEALASITFDSSGFSQAFALDIAKAEGDLLGSMGSLGNGIITAVQDIVAAIGGSIEGLPQISLKIRDGVIGVVVGGVKGKFKEMDDAISFAVSELLKQGEIAGLDAMVQAVLRGTSSSSLEGLTQDLESVMQVLSFGMTDSQEAVQGFIRELDTLRSQMTRMVGDSEQLTRALSNINDEEIRRWQSTRDQITGDQRSNAEKLEMLKRDGEMWNAEKALRLAELQQKKADLEAKFNLMKAQVDLYNADQEIGNKKYEFDLWKMRAQGQLLDTTGEMYMAELQMRNDYITTSMVMIQAQMDALGKVITAIGNMPDIDVPNLHLPGNGGTGAINTGPSPAEQRAEGLLAFINTQMLAGMSDMERALYELNAAFDAQREAAEEAGRVAELEALRLDAINRMRQQFLDGFRLAGLSDYQRSVEELNAAFAEQALLNPDLVGGEEELAEARRNALNALRDDLLDSFGTPMEALRDRIEDFQQRMRDLADANAELADQLKNGEISAREYADAIAHGDQVLNDFIMGLKSELLNMALYFTEAMGDTEMSANIRKQLAQLEWQYKKVEMRMMIEAIRAAGGFGEVSILMFDNMFDAIKAGTAAVITAMGAAVDGVLSVLPAPVVGDGSGPDPSDPDNPGTWSYEDWIEWLNSLPDLYPGTIDAGGNGNGNGNGDDNTNSLLDALRSAIERLRRSFEEYNNFLSDLRTTDLGGGTLRQQSDAMMAEFMQMLALAQSGDLDAIEALPQMAQQLLALLGQTYDPASTYFQSTVDMIESAMSGIRDTMGDVLDHVPATMDDAVNELHTIAEILAAIANGGLGEPVTGNPNLHLGLVYYGPDYGWHPVGWAPSGDSSFPVPPPPAPIPTTGSLAHIVPSASFSNASGSANDVDVVAQLTFISKQLAVQNALIESQTSVIKRKPVSISTAERGYVGPVRESFR